MRAGEDRMAAFRDVAWDKALAWLADRTGRSWRPSRRRRCASP